MSYLHKIRERKGYSSLSKGPNAVNLSQKKEIKAMYSRLKESWRATIDARIGHQQ
jgi:hypothetical protein